MSAEKAKRSAGPERVYRSIEAWRIARHETRAIRAFGTSFALSDDGRRWIDLHGGQGELLRLGRTASASSWSPGSADDQSFSFAGALWRDANQHSARWLIEEVAPKLRESTSDFEIRIVGDGAPSWLKSLCEETENVTFVGRVEDFEVEFARSRAVLAPTVFSAGVLLKAQRALECGAPLITNSLAADPLGLIGGVHCLIGNDPASFAAQMLVALSDTNRLSAVAIQGQSFWLSGSDWQETTREFLTKIGVH